MSLSKRTGWMLPMILMCAWHCRSADAASATYWGYYFAPESPQFILDMDVPPKYVDTYTREVPPYTFTAQPKKGWKVSCWRVCEYPEDWQYSSPDDYKAVGQGQLTLDAACLLDSYMSPELAIEFAYLNYDVQYLSDQGNMPSQVKNVGYVDTVTLPNMTATDYVFDGWKDEAGNSYAAGQACKGEDFPELDDVHVDGHVVKLMAQWTQKPTVTVEAGEHGTVAKNPDQEFYDVGSSVMLTATPDLGYAFENWGDGNVESNRVVTVTESKTYRATFTNRVYKLTFDSNGGSAVAPQFVRYLDYVGELPTPKKFGNVFKGWYTSPSGGQELTQQTKYDWPMDLTLTALWEQAPARVVAVKAEPEEGGTVSGGGSDFIAGDKTTLVATPSPGYSFREWSDGGAQSHQVTVQDDVQYTATFTGNVYKVTFDAAGGIASESSHDYVYGQPYGSFPAASREGHVFNGWFMQATGGDALKTNDVFKVADPDAGEIVFHAQWTIRPTFSIAYDGNGADRGTMAVQSVYCDGEGTNLTANAFLKADNRFLGWATVSGGPVEYADGAFVAADWAEPGKTNTLHAVWQEYTLAEAMHCETLKWTNVIVGKGSTIDIPWTVIATFDETVGSNTLSCVRQEQHINGKTSGGLTSSSIVTDGVLSFYWKPTGDNALMLFWINQKAQGDGYPEKAFELCGESGKWSYFSTNVQATAGSPLYVHILNDSDEAACDIDLMTWTPASTEPQRGDEVKIESATLANGVFKLGLPGEGDVNYGIWTNADVRAPVEEWGFMTNRVGADAAFELELKILPNEPKLFYRAYKVK